MSSLAYLGVAVLVSLVGCFFLWLRNRKPHSMEAHMDEFSRVLRAMAPEQRGRPVVGRDRVPGGRPRDVARGPAPRQVHGDRSDGGRRPG